MTARTLTLADRPDLAAAVPPLLASRWPAFMLAGSPGHGLDLVEVLLAAPAHQVLLVDGEEVLAAGLSVPLRWDGTHAGLPAGWDDAVVRGGALQAAGGSADAVCALSITMGPAAAGRRLSATMVAALKSAAADAGARALLAPVRPMLKHRYPLTPMAEYAGWTDAAGQVFDPWLRVHAAAGARTAGVAEESMTVTGTAAQWQEWAGLALPAAGAYVVPGALAPVHVDAAGHGRYVEPNVWMIHPIQW